MKDAAVPWDGGLLRRPSNQARRGNPRQGLGRGNGSSTELLGAHDASCDSSSRKRNISWWWSLSLPIKCWVLLAVSAITAFAVLRPLVSPTASISASAGARSGEGVGHHEQRLLDGGGGPNDRHHPSFSAGNGDSLDAAALSKVMIIGGYNNNNKVCIVNGI